MVERATSVILRLALSLTNSSEGKIVKVKGHRYRNNQLVIEVVSSFLYHGNDVVVSSTTKKPSTLRRTREEPDYLVHLESDADVGVL
jgi:fatty acid synthase subunit alpha, fungi type